MAIVLVEHLNVIYSSWCAAVNDCVHAKEMRRQQENSHCYVVGVDDVGLGVGLRYYYGRSRARPLPKKVGGRSVIVSC